MCFTMGMSAVLGTFSLGFAAYEYRNFKCPQYSLGVGYWGLMEYLQVVQHLYAAKKEDDYAMCSNPVNQQLTNLGLAHIVLQPLVVCVGLMSMYRHHDITARIEADLLMRLCIFMALWFPSYAWTCAFMGWEQTFIPPATPECPNYMWMQEGYDGFSGLTTPNIQGKPCTYYADTPTGHLAWAIPMFRQSYFLPGTSLHFFLFFAPYLVMFHRRVLQVFAIIFLIFGPILASYLTSSVNEQPAIWCFYSVIQAVSFSVVVRWKQLYKQPLPDRIHHPGSYGEQPLTYYSSPTTSEKESLLETPEGSLSEGEGGKAA